MKNLYSYTIYLSGSGITIKRNVYFDEEKEKYFIKYYGNYIEVRPSYCSFTTVESY